MSFYNSGIKKILKEVKNSAVNIRQNEGSDEKLAASVALNTAKTGITGAQSSAITLNSAKVSSTLKKIDVTATMQQWHELGADANTGYTLHHALNIKTCSIFEIRIEIWDSAGAGLTPTIANDFNLYFNMNGASQMEGNIGRIINVGLRENEETGVMVNTAMLGMMNRTQGAANMHPETATPLKMRASAVLPNSATMKMRLVVSFFEHLEAYAYE